MDFFSSFLPVGAFLLPCGGSKRQRGALFSCPKGLGSGWVGSISALHRKTVLSADFAMIYSSSASIFMTLSSMSAAIACWLMAGSRMLC